MLFQHVNYHLFEVWLLDRGDEVEGPVACATLTFRLLSRRSARSVTEVVDKDVGDTLHFGKAQRG